MIDWWQRPESSRVMALIRMGVGLLVLYDVLTTWRYTVELYSTAGPAAPMFALPVELPATMNLPTPDLSDLAHRATGEFHPTGGAIPSPLVAVIAQSLLIFTSLCVVVGWRTRISLLLTFLLIAWLRPLDVSWTFSKYTVIWLHLLGILQLSGCGNSWGLDADVDATGPAPANSALPRRLIQFLLCHIYFAAAVTKLKSAWFVGGELLQYSLLDRGWGGTALGQSLATSSFALRGISLATVLFELLFPFLIWVPRFRSTLLAVAVTFHVGIWVTMNVGLFSPTILVLLLAFLEPDRMEQIASRWIRKSTELPLLRWRSRWRSVWMYSAVGMVITLAGVAIQWECDWYGVFGRRSLRPLPHVPAEVVNSMRRGRKPALEDSVHRVAWGTWRGERDVLGDTRRIAIGGRLHVLVQFSVPHPAVRLEGVLIAPDGRLAARFEHQIDPGHSYAINGFELTRDFPIGTARVILQLDGYEFAARTFEIFDP